MKKRDVTQKNETQKIALELCKGKNEIFSKRGSRLIVAEDWYIRPFKDRFKIDDEDKFDEAFKIVTSGVGNELTKINSAISSSLLSLLFFYKLFNSSNYILNIDGIEYNKAFFEVRNKCVGFPSCVDVVLLSKDEKTLLFLESKFTEYIEGLSKKETYGKSYCELYKKIKELLNNNGIKIDSENKEKLVLLSSDKHLYIEGIKQSICHLIGLVQGPQNVKENKCSQSYYKEHIEYKDAFEKAEKLIYGTILFDLNKLNLEEGIYDSYYNLYIDIIGENGLEIVKAIREWAKISVEDEKIIVLPKPLSYQEIISNEKNKKYSESLSDSIKKFYGFDKLQE